MTLAGCADQVKVSESKTKELLEKAQASLHLERDNLIGSKWYAGRFAEKFGFQRTEGATLKAIELAEFTCMKKQVGSWWTMQREIDCHSFINFKFKAGGEEKIFSTIVKFKNIKNQFRSPASVLNDRLAYGFVRENPFSKRTFAKYWKVLKKGKLAVGMPVDYLKICWGKPLRVFDKSIDANGTRETFVYDRYFVLLENGIVQSIHKFDS